MCVFCKLIDCISSHLFDFKTSLLLSVLTNKESNIFCSSIAPVLQTETQHRLGISKEYSGKPKKSVVYMNTLTDTTCSILDAALEGSPPPVR